MNTEIYNHSIITVAVKIGMVLEAGYVITLTSPGYSSKCSLEAVWRVALDVCSIETKQKYSPPPITEEGDTVDYVRL